MLQAVLGCTSDAPQPNYAGSPFPTRRCVRHAIDRVPGLSGVLTLYNNCEGSLGPGVLTMAAPLVYACGWISRGEAWDREQKAKSK